MRKSATSKELDNFKIAELEAIVANRTFEERWYQSYFPERGLSERLEGSCAPIVEDLGQVVAKGDSFETCCSVKGCFAFVDELEDILFEIGVDRD